MVIVLMKVDFHINYYKLIDNYLKLLKAFMNNSSANINLLKAQLSKLSQKNSKKLQLDRFLDRFLGPLMKVSLSIMKNAIKPLAKTFLIPLGLAAAVAAEVLVRDVLWD